MILSRSYRGLYLLKIVHQLRYSLVYRIDLTVRWILDMTDFPTVQMYPTNMFLRQSASFITTLLRSTSPPMFAVLYIQANIWSITKIFTRRISCQIMKLKLLYDTLTHFQIKEICFIKTFSWTSINILKFNYKNISHHGQSWCRRDLQIKRLIMCTTSISLF